MNSDVPDSTEQLEIVEHLQSGENVVLIGPNQGFIERLAVGAKNELAKRYKIGHIRVQKNGALNLIDRDLLDAHSLGASHFVAEGISPEQAFYILTKHPHFTLLATMPMAQVLGVTLIWAKLLQIEFGEKSRMAEHLLPEFLKTLRFVGVSFSSTDPAAKGSFREKLLSARYNQTRVATDHGTLLKGWTDEGDACDPGWELDRSK